VRVNTDNGPDRGEAYVSYTGGGYLSSVSFEDAQAGNRTPPRKRGGGLRGRVRGLSDASRLRLQRRVAKVNRHAFRASKGRVYFITLTYPEVWPEDPQVCKAHVKAFRKRLQRMFGGFAAFWRIGIQKRGAWHYHILLFAPASFGSLKELRDFVSKAWYEVCGRVSDGHLQAGTCVDELRTWKRVRYAGLYLAKKEDFPEGLNTGRAWGAWNEELLPVQWEMVKVTMRDAFRIRRVFRRLARMKSTSILCTLTVFVEHENVLKLLEHLGYRRE
jgi:hypothetical protein